MAITGDRVRFLVRLTETGQVWFRRDRGCSRPAMLAICRAVIGGQAAVSDVTPTEVDELAKAKSVKNPYWRESLLIRFAAQQRPGGLIEIDRACGCTQENVLELCQSLLDSAHHRELDEYDDTHYHRHMARAG